MSLPAVSIRAAQPSDLSQLVDIQVSALRILCAKDYRNHHLKALIENKSQLRQWDETIWVAEFEGKLIGFGALANDKPYINGLFVHPRHVRQGIGSKLLRAIEQEAQKRDVQRLWVASSLTAQGFYQHRGYHRVGRSYTQVNYQTTVPCITLQKWLVPVSPWKQIWIGLTEQVIPWLVIISFWGFMLAWLLQMLI